MTRAEAIQFLDNMKHEEAGRAIGKDGFYAELMGYHVEALNIAIKALEHPEQNVIAVVPCGDAISRQAVLKLFATHDGKHLFEAIRDLPTVTPTVTEFADRCRECGKQRTGHWLEDDCGEIECDRCHKEFSIFNNDTEKFNYCPWCGVKMAQESEEI